MSFAEILEQVEQLAPEEQQALQRRLDLLALTQNPEYIAEMTRRIDAIEAGEPLVDATELRRLLAARRRDA
jgi:hypothetical protein